MLSVSALQSATRFVAAALSPSKTCRVRVPAMNGSMFRYDPYAFRVLASPLASTPSRTAQPQPMASEAQRVPAANRSLLDILAVPAAMAVAAVTAAPAVEAPVAAAPAAPVEASAIRYAYIRFKHDVLVYVAPFRIVEGDLVLVEGDRGEDIGCVERITTDKPAFPVPLKVTRKAGQKDRDNLAAKRLKEEAAIRTTQALADSLGMAMQVADCEFQLDYGKLTVFFRSKQRYMDFRKLQRGLFREFRCRIWLTESNRHIAAEKPLNACVAGGL